MLTNAQVVETSVTVTNSSFQNNTHPDDHTRQTTKSLGVQVNVFANKFKVDQHRDHNQFIALMLLFMVRIDSLHTILAGTQTPILLPCNLKR